MQELIDNSKEELKRIDHLVYVTLKYTRTVDVFISVIDRMINAYGFIVDALLKKAIDEGTIVEEPQIPVRRAELAYKLNDSKKIRDSIKKYLLLRKVIRAPYEKECEFRRHVKMSLKVDNKLVEINIDNITQDFHKLKDFVLYIEKKLQENQ